MRVWLGLVSLLFVLSGCQHAMVRLEEALLQTAERYAHLNDYHKQSCEVRVRFAEPAKTSWLEKLKQDGTLTAAGSSSQVFVRSEETVFDWNASQVFCRVTQRRMTLLDAGAKKVVADVGKKLDLSLCIWMQSFYSDSPMRGWKNHKATTELQGQHVVRMNRGEGRYLEADVSGAHVVAQMDKKTRIEAEYTVHEGLLYPSQIVQLTGGTRSVMSEIAYEAHDRRAMPSSFWLRLPDSKGQDQAYLRAELRNCTWD